LTLARCGARGVFERQVVFQDGFRSRGMTGKAWKVTLIVLGIIASLLFIALGALAVQMNGGIVNTIRNLKPRPDLNDVAIKSDRKALEAAIEGALQPIGTNRGFTAYATSKDDRCYEGQNNYKVTEGFAHRCTLRLTRFYGFDGDFRQKMIDLEKTLIDAGWKNGLSYYPQASEHNMENMMIDYYDRYYGRNYLTVEKIATPIGYHTSTLKLEIGWAEKETRDLSRLESNQRIRSSTQFYERHELQSADQLFNKATQDHRYFVGIAIYGHYFEN
jgi:hypothetical protein